MEVFLPCIYHFYCTHCLGNQDRVCSWHHSGCLGSKTLMCQCTDTCVVLHLVYETTNLQYTAPFLLPKHDTETVTLCISQLQHIQELYLWDVCLVSQHRPPKHNVHFPYIIDLASSRKALNKEAKVWSQASPCRICGRKNGTETDSSSSTSVFPLVSLHQCSIQ